MPTPQGDIWTDETFSPGYVWFRCATYDLPDNTAGAIGYHSVYRPLATNQYAGHELVTDRMRSDLRVYYAAQEAEQKAMQRAAAEREQKRLEVLNSIPAAGVNELDESNSRLRAHFRQMNEGGEGFVYQHSWLDKTGREILRRHNVNVDAVVAAISESPAT